MKDWVKVDTNELNKEVPKDIHGVSVLVSFSPYDVPQFWRYYREPNSNFFIIEFKYLLDEATSTPPPPPNAPVELEVGENSKRLYKIKVDVVKLGSECNHAKLEIAARSVVGAIEQFKKTVPQKLQERYKMPENVVFNNRNEIFSSMAG